MIGIATVVQDCEFGISIRLDESVTEGSFRDGDHRGRVATNPLERLVQIMHTNERLMDELATIRRRIVRARDYLNSAGSNARFGAGNLAHCKNKHRGVLAQLRANRIEVSQLLGLDGERDAS